MDSPSLRPMGAETPGFRLPRRIFIGSVVSPQSLVSLKIIKRAVVGVGSSGVIRFVDDLDEFDEGDKTVSNGKDGASKRQDNKGVPAEEDRSSTPVNIPGRTAKTPSVPSIDDGTGLSLPPAALDNGYLTEQYDREQALLESVVGRHGWRLQDCETVMLSPNSFLSPGFVDTHVHAPQVPNLGRGQQYELLDWLDNITFPREKKFEDPIYARRTYESVVQRMLDCGTTCAAIYATLHEEATMILARICNDKGMRAFVGKCQMDRNAPVDYKEKNSSASMESTKRFINFCRNMEPYGTPQSPRSDPLNSTGSVEMDESIARLSVTMKGLLDGESAVDDKNEERSGASAVRPQSVDMASSGESSEQSDTSTKATSVASTSGGETATGQPSKLFDDLQRKRSLSSRISGNTSASLRGHPASRQSTSSAASGSGNATPRKLREMENANALVQPILTPRFAIACSDALLASISALVSRDATLRVQTHLSENPGEIAFTKTLFPFCKTYTDVYDHFSLLTPRTILAHAIHLDDQEISLIAERKCGISHCPTSNLNLRSGASKLGELLNRGIKVGLGTDMSGGFGMSILTAIRDASIVAKVLQFSPNGEAQEQRPTEVMAEQQKAANGAAAAESTYDFCKGPLPIATLFYLATLGGAEVCNLAHRIGSIEPGKVRTCRVLKSLSSLLIPSCPAPTGV